MRYRAAEKLEIIRLVEQSSLSARRTLAQLGISRATFYRWYQRYRARAAADLEQTPGSGDGGSDGLGAQGTGVVATGTGHRVCRPAAVLCFGGVGLSAIERRAV